MTSRRLIEAAFPLERASLDSVHEKSVRHGHISTLRIWPPRRPLAASRAALLATLLPDPVSANAKRELLRQMAGRVVDKLDRDGEVTGQTTEGGILHWGRESAGGARSPSLARARQEELHNGSPANATARFHPLSPFRQQVLDAFGGKPRESSIPSLVGALSPSKPCAWAARSWRPT